MSLTFARDSGAAPQGGDRTDVQVLAVRRGEARPTLQAPTGLRAEPLEVGVELAWDAEAAVLGWYVERWRQGTWVEVSDLIDARAFVDARGEVNDRRASPSTLRPHGRALCDALGCVPQDGPSGGSRP